MRLILTSLIWRAAHFLQGKRLTSPQAEQHPQPQQPKKHHTAMIGLIIILACLGVLLYVELQTTINPKADPQVTGLSGHEGFQGFNYVYYVEVTVKNRGAKGTITVYAEINTTGKYEQKQQTFYIPSGVEQTVQFVFNLNLWQSLGSQIRYKAWATP